MAYPNSLDTFTTKTDGIDDVMAADINSIQSAVKAVETELGTLPKGAYTSVKERLDAIEATGTVIHSATEKTIPVDADEFGIWDSVAGLFKKLTWENLKAALKTYFDSIYIAIGAATGSADWISAEGEWAYLSATSVTVPTGAASKYSVGDKWKLTSNGSVLQGFIVAIADTILTVKGNALTNYAFTNVYFSHQLTPVGFTHWYNYTPTGPTNTTLSGRFTIIGRTVKGDINGLCTGVPSFASMPTLPIVAGANMIRATVMGSFTDSGSANRFGKVTGYIDSSDTSIHLYNGDSASGDMPAFSSTVPITWAAGDNWNVHFEYEI